MKDTLHIYTDGGYNYLVKESYFGFLIYKESGIFYDILTVKTKRVKKETDFEKEGLLMALDYLTKSNIHVKLNAKVVVHSEMFSINQINSVKIKGLINDFRKIVPKRNISFKYSPAHNWELFNLMIDTLISSNNIRLLVYGFSCLSLNSPYKTQVITSNIQMNLKGYINMFLIIHKEKLITEIKKNNINDLTNIKKPKIKIILDSYNELVFDKIILYKGKKLIY